MLRDDILARVTARYLDSSDFNGLPLDAILAGHDVVETRRGLEQLVREGLVSLCFDDDHPNPHIKAFSASDAETQLCKLQQLTAGLVCVYPERPHLEQVVDRRQFEGQPFTLEMALGRAQLEFDPFDLAVLERYRDDPRYDFTNDDISGSIGIRDAYYGPNGAPVQDQVSMQTFGFCFDEDLNCFVAAFMRYLKDLSPQHQQHWAGYRVARRTELHPDYFRPAILGEFPENVSIYEAITLEMQAINAYSRAMGRAPLFRQDFRDHPRPPQYGRLVRPTAHEHGLFVLALDRMLSDNIDSDFFGPDVERVERVVENEEVLMRPKGSLRQLGEWIDTNFRPADAETRANIAEMIKTFRDVRRLRQAPAHGLNPNEYDQQLTRDQRELVRRVYRALKTLRLLLSRHRGTIGVEIDDNIQLGRIWSM